jgi:DNA repair exonuclease SbcCD ATPase subunit
MNELIQKISSDPLLMLSAAVGVVVVLFVVLVVIIATMRIKTYKDRYVNTALDNKEKKERIDTLEYELQRYQMDNAQQAQLLSQFDETKKRLAQTTDTLAAVRKELADTQSLLARTKAQLESTESMHAALKEEHAELKERLGTLHDENNKLRVNNARLLMKLETGEQLAAHMEQRKRTGVSEEGE